MPIKKNSGRQELVVAYVDIALADLGTAAQGAIELPNGAVLVGGDVVVKTAFNAATTATLKVGDAADDDRYTGTAADIKSAGRTALTITGHVHKAEDLMVTFAQTGTAATTGQLRLTVQYYVEKRTAFSQG